MELLVLAAGMGSRYGGLKQIDPVGPSGESLLDYAVFDALRAGFRRVTFVIRRDFEEVFERQVAAKYRGQVSVATVFQEMADLPDGFAPGADRIKPWGTGHAVWCARETVREPFAVINADDFYGADSFRRLAEFLRMQGLAEEKPSRFAMVGFRLDRTLSEHGTVSRGVGRVEAGHLVSIVERTAIAAADVGAGRAYRGDEIVSMNCWGFTPSLFPALGRGLRSFLQARGAEPKAEFYLPASVAELIAAGEARVDVLPTEADWFGVTYREDRPRVAAAIAARVCSGAYPLRLF
ncbi:MAG: nucleotidyltransferase family protein [Opitutaceae bacterium]